MEILPQYNLTRFMAFIPTIRKSVEEWRIVEASLSGQTSHNIGFIAKKIQTIFKGLEGVIFICNSREIIALVRTGKAVSTDILSEEINTNLPEHSCKVHTGDITAEGLLTIQVKLDDKIQQKDDRSLLLETRQTRKHNVVMVVDDDSFIRSIIGKNFSGRAEIIAVEDCESVVETYLEHLPDIVFLDIHMGKISGIDLLDEILGFDASAHIVMVSLDSQKDNVLESKTRGAKGFLAKPFTIERLESCYAKSATIKKLASGS